MFAELSVAVLPFKYAPARQHVSEMTADSKGADLRLYTQHSRLMSTLALVLVPTHGHASSQ